MATYTVKAPDGKMVTLEGPDGASQADVIAQAQKLYQPKPVAAPAAPPAKPKLTLRPQDAKRGLEVGSARLEASIKNLPEAAKQQARQQYFDMTKDLLVASATPAAKAKNARFPQQQMQNNARARANQEASGAGNFLTALKGGITRGAFGLPERLAAAGARFLPSSITGNNTNASYDEILDQVRANTDAELEKSFGGNILGQLMGGLTGAAPARAIVGIGSKVPVLANAARVAATVAPKTTKVATLAAGGAAGGAAQAAGEGSDVSTGAVAGAIGGPALVGLGKGAKWLLRPVADMIGLPSAGNILRRFTSAKADEIRQAAEQYRQTTGAEPTLYEILPLQDRNKLAKNIVGRSPATSERAVAAVKRRVDAVGPEMARTARGATAQRRARVLAQMQRDAEEATGVVDAAPLPGIEAATRGPLPMADRRRAIDDTIMAPVRDEPVADDVNALMPTTLERAENGDISEVISDPEMAKAIRNAAGSLTLRRNPEDMLADLAGLTANDAANILRNLSKLKPDSDNYGAAQRAIPHILDILDQRAPQASEAIQRMRAAHAANRRMAEGMDEGAMTRTRSTAPVGREQPVRNAYDTPEGTDGRFLGQSNRLEADFNGTPREALRAVDDIAESGQVQDALAGNLGREEGGAISAAAEAQARGVRNLAAVSKETGADAETLGLADLAKGILGLSPSSMVATKVAALSRMLTLTRLPEKKAKAVVDMLFSQDPAMTNRAIGLLNSAGRDGKAFLSDLTKSINLGARAGQAGNAVAEEQPGGATPDVGIVPEAVAAEIPDAPPQDQEPDGQDDNADGSEDKPYGHAVVAALYPEAEITSDVRAPDDPLSLKNPDSWHTKSDEAVDVRPIPGMTFHEFITGIEDAGYTIIEARDEEKHPIPGLTTGPHWHVVIG